jgi:tetratricopeptide (TPR) repeat protein
VTTRVLLAVSFFLILVPQQAFGRTSRVAILGLRQPGISTKYVAKADDAFSIILKKERTFTPVPDSEIKKGLEEVLSGILKEEIVRAQDHYYHFRFQEAERLLSARDDPEALQWKGLIAYSAGDEKKARHYLIRLLEIDPRAKVSVKDFPPRLVSLFEEVRRERPKGYGKANFLQVGSGIYIPEKFVESWKIQFRKMAEEMRWDFILLHRIEPIGWNYKMTGTLFSLKGKGEDLFRIRAVELVDIRDLNKASEILIKSLFFY